MIEFIKNSWSKMGKNVNFSIHAWYEFKRTDNVKMNNQHRTQMADKDVFFFYLSHGIELVQCISLQQLFTKWQILATITDQITIHHISGFLFNALNSKCILHQHHEEEKWNHQTKIKPLLSVFNLIVKPLASIVPLNMLKLQISESIRK